MTDLRWGILGAAKFAREYMGPAIAAAPGGQLVAIATSSADKAAPFKVFAPGLQVFDSYDALLADPTIDVVYIPLPNVLHVDWALKAMAAGKHVLVEKPIAMSEDDFDTLIAARDRAGVLAAEAYMIVHHPQWHRTRQLLAEGAIGQIRSINVAFSFNNPDPTNIRNQAGTGGGGLRDIGVYTMGSVRFALQLEPDAIASQITYDNGVDTYARVTARFGEADYSMYTSIRMAPYQEVVFHGTDGVLKLPVPFNPRVFGEARIEVHKGPNATIERFPTPNHYELQVANFNLAARDGTPYLCPLEFSRGTQRMIDAAFAACPAD